MLEIFIFLQKQGSKSIYNVKFSHCPRQHFQWYKNPNLFWKMLGDDVTLVQCPFKNVNITFSGSTGSPEMFPYSPVLGLQLSGMRTFFFKSCISKLLFYNQEMSLKCSLGAPVRQGCSFLFMVLKKNVLNVV